MFRFNRYYFCSAIFLFCTEVIIALYAHDQFIRPYFGDFLVVILLYTAIKSVLNSNHLKTALFVLIFSYIIEISQYFELYKILHLQNSKLSCTVMGTYFSWTDILAYTLGIFVIILTEMLISNIYLRYLTKQKGLKSV
jgi:DNA integrity scanning protein DisA with diadenylate cyclase activity